MNPNTAKLPEKIRELVRSEDLMITTEQIALAHDLRPEYYGAIYRCTVMVLKCQLEAKDFVNSLVYELDVTRENAIAIAQDVNRDIFNAVREELKQLHEIGDRATTSSQSGDVLNTSLPPTTLSPFHLSDAKASTLQTQTFSSPPAFSHKTQPTPEPTKVPEVAATNIFEQKLGNAFRLKAETSSNSSSAVASPAAPPVAPTVPPATPLTESTDPYRESV